jgi:hypothetical protein
VTSRCYDGAQVRNTSPTPPPPKDHDHHHDCSSSVCP